MATIQTILVSDATDGTTSKIEDLIRRQPELAFVNSIGLDEATKELSGFSSTIVWVELEGDSTKGLDVLKKLISANPNSYFIVSKENIDADLVKKAMQIGALDFLDHKGWSAQIRSVIRRVATKEWGAQKTSTAIRSAIPSSNIKKSGAWAIPGKQTHKPLAKPKPLKRPDVNAHAKKLQKVNDAYKAVAKQKPKPTESHDSKTASVDVEKEEASTKIKAPSTQDNEAKQKVSKSEQPESDKASVPPEAPTPTSATLPDEEPDVVEEPTSATLPEEEPDEVSEPPSAALPEEEPDEVSEPPSAALPEEEPDELSEPPSAALPEEEPDEVSEPTSTAPPEEEPDEVSEPTSTALPEEEPDEVSEPTSTALPEEEPDEVPEPTSTALPEEEPDEVSEPTSTILPEEEPDEVSEPTSTILPEEEPDEVSEPTSTILPEEEPDEVSEPTSTILPEEEPIANLAKDDDIDSAPGDDSDPIAKLLAQAEQETSDQGPKEATYETIELDDDESASPESIAKSLTSASKSDTEEKEDSINTQPVKKSKWEELDSLISTKAQSLPKFDSLKDVNLAGQEDVAENDNTLADAVEALDDTETTEAKENLETDKKSDWDDLDSIVAPQANKIESKQDLLDQISKEAETPTDKKEESNIGTESKWDDLDSIPTPGLDSAKVEPALQESENKWEDLDSIKSPDTKEEEPASLGAGGKWGDLDSIPSPGKTDASNKPATLGAGSKWGNLDSIGGAEPAAKVDSGLPASGGGSIFGDIDGLDGAKVDADPEDPAAPSTIGGAKWGDKGGMGSGRRVKSTGSFGSLQSDPNTKLVNEEDKQTQDGEQSPDDKPKAMPVPQAQAPNKWTGKGEGSTAAVASSLKGMDDQVSKPLLTKPDIKFSATAVWTVASYLVATISTIMLFLLLPTLFL